MRGLHVVGTDLRDLASVLNCLNCNKLFLRRLDLSHAPPRDLFHRMKDLASVSGGYEHMKVRFEPDAASAPNERMFP